MNYIVFLITLAVLNVLGVLLMVFGIIKQRRESEPFSPLNRYFTLGIFCIASAVIICLVGKTLFV